MMRDHKVIENSLWYHENQIHDFFFMSATVWGIRQENKISLKVCRTIPRHRERFGGGVLLALGVLS